MPMRAKSVVSRRLLSALIASLIGFSVSPTQAQWIGATSGTTNDAAHSYTTTANWTGGIVLDTFSPAALTTGTTIYFGEDRTTAGLLDINYAHNATVSFTGGGLFNGAGAGVAAANHVLTLGGNVNVDIGTSTNNLTATLGSVAADSALDINLGGATRTFSIATGDTLFLTNSVTGTGGITKEVAGSILVLAGAGNYDGITTVNAGSLSVRNNTGLGTTAGGTVVNGVSGTNLASLQLQGSITITDEALTISGNGAGAGDGSGVSGGVFRNISGNNTWTGPITVLAAATTRVNSNAGTLTLSGNIAMSPTAGDQFVLQGAGNGLISGNLTGPSRLTKGANGGGTWVLAGTNNYVGSTTVSSGALQFAKRVSLYNADPLQWTASNLIAGNGGTFTFNLGGTDEFTSAEILSLNNTIAFNAAGGSRLGLDISNAGGAFTYSNVISNGSATSINFLKTGTGNLTLSANNTFTGTLGINGGTLTLTGANAFTGLATANNAVINVQNNAALGTTAAGVTVAGANGQLQLQGGMGDLTITGEALTLANDINNGTGAVLNVSGNNVWTGNVTINPTSTNNIIRISANSGSKLTFTGDVSITSATEQVVLSQGDGVVEYTGIISGTGARVTKSSGGLGTLILSGANTYTGATQISGGTVLVGIDAPNGGTGISGAFGNATSAVNITTTNSQGPKVFTNGAFTIGRNITTVTSGTGTILGVTLGGNAAATSSFTGSITIGAGAPMTFSQVANGIVNISGAVTGSPAVTIDGGGTVNFNNLAKAYTGTTTVNSLAKLLVNTTVASPTVNVNGTLGGSGTLSGVVNVGAAGIIAPGNSAGTLTTGALTLDALSLLNFELAAPGTIGSNINDLLTVNGAIALNGTVNVTDLGGFGVGSYRLIDYTGAFSGSGLTVGTIPLGYSAIVDTSVANQVNLVVSVIPEPSTFVLGAVGILGFAILRRRRAR